MIRFEFSETKYIIGYGSQGHNIKLKSSGVNDITIALRKFRV